MCGAGPQNRHSFSRFVRATVRVCHPSERGAKACGWWRARPHSLTAPARPIDSADESGGPTKRRCGRRANRELRCDSGTAPPLYPGASASRGSGSPDLREAEAGRLLSRPSLSVPLRRPARRGPSREGDSRSSLGVRRPTSIRMERGISRGRDPGHGPCVRAVGATAGGRSSASLRDGAPGAIPGPPCARSLRVTRPQGECHARGSRNDAPPVRPQAAGHRSDRHRVGGP